MTTSNSSRRKHQPQSVPKSFSQVLLKWENLFLPSAIIKHITVNFTARRRDDEREPFSLLIKLLSCNTVRHRDLQQSIWNVVYPVINSALFVESVVWLVAVWTATQYINVNFLLTGLSKPQLIVGPNVSVCLLFCFVIGFSTFKMRFIIPSNT